jgi:hypothetical protein
MSDALPRESCLTRRYKNALKVEVEYRTREMAHSSDCQNVRMPPAFFCLEHLHAIVRILHSVFLTRFVRILHGVFLTRFVRMVVFLRDLDAFTKKRCDRHVEPISASLHGW